MGIFKDINDSISDLLCRRGISSKIHQKDEIDIEMENYRIEKQARLERERIEKLEKEKRSEEWLSIKDHIYSKYQLPIADDAKKIAKDLFEKSIDTVSVFFITDERVVRNIYIEGGDRAIDECARNLIERAFIGGPITATLLRRLKLLEDAKKDGKVIDTEIDIDGFVPFARIEYAIDEIELDGQIIPAKRKFSIRCEMTTTLTEGFRVGPFVSYDELYLSTKEEVEQITDEDIDITVENLNSKMLSKDNIANALAAAKYGKNYKIEVCPHGTDKRLYCNMCQGDVIISPSKKIIGICLDISGSMYGERLRSAKMAIIKILKRIPVNSNINVVLIIFSSDLPIGHYECIIQFGTEYSGRIRNMAIDRINYIRADGGTPLYEAINFFLDGIWPGIKSTGKKRLLSENHIFYPYTYLIIISDGGENGSELGKLIYGGKIGSDAFFVKIKAYRDAGLLTEVIPFAYIDDGERNNVLLKELRDISGKKIINESNSENIIESLLDNVDSILYGKDNLKVMGLSISGKNKD